MVMIARPPVADGAKPTALRHAWSRALKQSGRPSKCNRDETSGNPRGIIHGFRCAPSVLRLLFFIGEPVVLSEIRVGYLR